MADSGCEDTVPTMAPSLCKMPEESDASMRQRLFTSLSQSFPHSQLYKALHGGENIMLGGDNSEDDDDDSLYGDHLSNSCFASLRMDRRDSDDFDDDLRSLEWLQSEDLLKNIGGEKLDKEDGEEQKENEDVKPDINLLQSGLGGQPTNLPYLPTKQVNSKPPYSFSCLIFMAVEHSPQKRLPVKDIYNWILTQFPYFQNAPTGWKNSVRHNLSLNKCFKKVDKDKGQSIGKGSLWCIDPAYRPNLLQALRKTPYHPYHQLQMTSTLPQNYNHVQCLPGRSVLPLTQRPVPNTVSPHLFPFLSRRLAQTSFDVDNEMKDVAQTLVSMKGFLKKETSDSSPGEDIGPTWKHHKRSYSYNHPRRRPSSPVVVTDHPYNDHAYSSSHILDDDMPSPSSSSSIDEEYEFGSDADEEGESDFGSDMEWDSDDKDEVDGDLISTKRLKIDLREDSVSDMSKPSVQESEDDEQKKIHEGANALLNLAGLLLNQRNNPGSGCDNNSPRKRGESSAEAHKRGKKKSSKDSSKVEVTPQKSRPTTKRKNAGSNGKYKDYASSLKPVKSTSPGKSQTALTGADRGSKNGANKSLGGKQSAKPLKQKGKNYVKSSANNKQTNKSGGAKRKLKLSKTFSAANKVSTKKGVSNINDNVNKQTEVCSKTKKSNKKETSKRSLTGMNKKAKETTWVNGRNQTEPKNTVPEDNDSISNNHAVANNNNVDKAISVLRGGDSSNQEKCNVVKDLKADGASQKCTSLTSIVSGDAITAAGDAPEKSNHVDIKIDTAPISATPHICNELKTGVDLSNTLSKETFKMGINAATAQSHKSPHFTRFSKKKAAMS